MVISIANQKGGVAKTTSAINIAYYLADAGKKTLLIDFDPQSSASSGLGKRNLKKSIYDLFYDESFSNIFQYTNHKNLFLLPSNQNLAAFEFEAMKFEERELKLKNILDKIPEFDYVIIDCPPSLGLLTINALAASEYIIVPVQSEFFALEGLSLLLETAAKVKKLWNSKLEILGILLTMYDSRNMFHKEVEMDIKKHFGKKVFDTIIKRNIRLAESSSFGKSIEEYDKHSKGAKAYLSVVSEIFDKIKK